jgi:hypothetical protein
MLYTCACKEVHRGEKIKMWRGMVAARAGKLNVFAYCLKLAASHLIHLLEARPMLEMIL